MSFRHLHGSVEPSWSFVSDVLLRRYRYCPASWVVKIGAPWFIMPGVSSLVQVILKECCGTRSLDEIVEMFGFLLW